MTTEKIFYRNDRAVRVWIGQHVLLADGSKGHVTKIGRKYIEVLVYRGKRVRGIDPLVHKVTLLDTSHQ